MANPLFDLTGRSALVGGPGSGQHDGSNSVAAPGRTRGVAGAFVFLASEAASYITGQALPVDRGMVM